MQNAQSIHYRMNAEATLLCDIVGISLVMLPMTVVTGAYLIACLTDLFRRCKRKAAGRPAKAWVVNG